MQRIGTWAIMVALVSIAAVVAACGGESGTDPATDGGTASLTKGQFVKQGDQICRQNYAKRQKVLAGYLLKAQEEGAPPPQALQEKVMMNQILPIFWEESKELNELGLPVSERQKARVILRDLESAIMAVESELDVAIKEGTGVQFARVEQLAHSYGFEYCGRS